MTRESSARTARSAMYISAVDALVLGRRGPLLPWHIASGSIHSPARSLHEAGVDSGSWAATTWRPVFCGHGWLAGQAEPAQKQARGVALVESGSSAPPSRGGAWRDWVFTIEAPGPGLFSALRVLARANDGARTRGTASFANKAPTAWRKGQKIPA
ncbi:hypothetical protein P154DRAFT_231424 [Amniculicola lignicola CBS 123094]|uniref:Uncharacterized protein n=1 Tax=Amniculicola lignicola CBS 123094 TaxID=1392246 RepID=A0A6A5WES0_9PLEO|nr:hypothetical protein P154DRAFT_231424 [Amniculicola lignicola CBS 123094]